MYVITIKGVSDIEKVLKILKKKGYESIEEIELKIVIDDYKVVAGLKGAGIRAEVVKVKAL